jgi:hypothetical protein
VLPGSSDLSSVPQGRQISPNPTPGSREPLGADLIIPALALGLAVYFFFSIADLAWEAKANGMFVGGVLILLIIIQAVRIGVQVAGGRGDLRFDRLLLPREALPKRIGLVMLTAVFIFALPWLGLTLALLLAMSAALYLMGVRKPSQLVGTAVGAAAAAYLMFFVALDSDFPRGPIEHLIAALL